jgi:UDP-N-acetylenolpyruvoylglucosamine reductase
MQVSKNISLKPYNTFSIDVRAARFAVFKNIDEARELLKLNCQLSMPSCN